MLQFMSLGEKKIKTKLSRRGPDRSKNTVEEAQKKILVWFLRKIILFFCSETVLKMLAKMHELKSLIKLQENDSKISTSKTMV